MAANRAPAKPRPRAGSSMPAAPVDLAVLEELVEDLVSLPEEPVEPEPELDVVVVPLGLEPEEPDEPEEPLVLLLPAVPLLLLPPPMTVPFDEEPPALVLLPPDTTGVVPLATGAGAPVAY